MLSDAEHAQFNAITAPLADDPGIVLVSREARRAITLQTAHASLTVLPGQPLTGPGPLHRSLRKRTRLLLVALAHFPGHLVRAVRAERAKG